MSGPPRELAGVIDPGGLHQGDEVPDQWNHRVLICIPRIGVIHKFDRSGQMDIVPRIVRREGIVECLRRPSIRDIVAVTRPRGFGQESDQVEPDLPGLVSNPRKTLTALGATLRRASE